MARRKPLTDEEKEDAIERAQSLMVMGMPYRAVLRTLIGEFSITRRTAEGYVTMARKEWLEEAETPSREQHRAVQYAMALNVMKSAFGKRKIRTLKGQPVLDSEGKYVTDPDPDYKLAHRCIETLARLSGTFQHRIELEAEGSIERFVARIASEFADDPEVLERILSVGRPAP